MYEIIWMQAAPWPEFQVIPLIHLCTGGTKDSKVFCTAARGTTALPLLENMELICESLSGLLHIYWQMFCRRNFPCTLKVRKKLKFPGRDKHNTLRLFCRYHFTAALKRLQPDHKSWLLSVLPRCHRDFGCHTLVLIPPRGQQTARGTEPLGELCQP